MSALCQIKPGFVIAITTVVALCGCKKGNDGTSTDPNVAVKELVLPSDKSYLFDQIQNFSYQSPSGFSSENQTTKTTTASITIDAANAVSYVSNYIFGLNATPYTGIMSDNSKLMGNIASLKPGIIRGPGGSLSDTYFWNCSADNMVKDIPATLTGSSDPFSPWPGIRPNSWESWAMGVDSLYSIIKKTQSTGMITVNYGYARYGTGDNPVAKAAHLAAEWVRYDKGRTKFWEIGNEVSGSWEAGYQINTSENKDGQPQIITPELYAAHCKVFMDSMRKAAKEVNATIYIGAVMAEASSADNGWNLPIMKAIGNSIDFYIIHSYFTPYNQNSGISVILDSPSKLQGYKSYLQGQMTSAGVPEKPIALTEYNIFAVGSKQQVSHIGGIFSTLVACEAAKSKIGVAIRWDICNGFGTSGDDHGMFSYNEPGVANYTPYPAFYYQYYLRKCLGNYMLSGSSSLSSVLTYPSRFSSGDMGVVLINKTAQSQVAELIIDNFIPGTRYYFYCLTGGTDNGGFSRKVFVNGKTSDTAVGGPADVTAVSARSSLINGKIKVELPAYAVVYMLIPEKS